MVALCDKCNRNTNITFQTKDHPNNIVETYIQCEHCQTITTCFVTDEQVREMQSRMVILRASPDTSTEMLEAMQIEVNDRMSELKRMISNGIE